MKVRLILSDYERFSKALLVERLYLDPNISFRSLCRRLGVRSKDLDICLMAELGYHGQEIMEHFRFGDIKNLLRLHN